MRTGLALKGSVLATVVFLTAAVPNKINTTVMTGVDAPLKSISTLAFGPNGVLYTADPQAATIYAIELGAAATKGTAGTKDVVGVDAQVASLLGTDASQITITDLAVDARTRNSYMSVMRGKGMDAKPALMRVDGDGQVSIVDMETLKYTAISLPNAPDANGGQARSQSVTDMAYQDGTLYVAGLSNEEFSSKLRALPYPFKEADRGTSVEIYHGSHGGFETRSPVFSFVPLTIDNQPYLIGGYLCTPLVKFPVASLAPGAKVQGTTIAELGAGNRPIDMITYKKDGKQFLLMANTSRGVMKIPTASFGSDAPITAPVNGTQGVAYETIASMQGIVQMDLLDATHSVVLAKAGTALNLQAVILP
ncbi:MAG: hypothetical protein ABJB66_03550 [Gemmatimonadaceae bacterium]